MEPGGESTIDLPCYVPPPLALPYNFDEGVCLLRGIGIDQIHSTLVQFLIN